MKNLKQVYKNCLDSAGQSFLQFPWHDKGCYSAWLAQTYFYAQATTRLLMLAGAHIDREFESTHLRFIEHTKEERGHEKLLLMDLKDLNFQLSDFSELASTSGLYQAQYFWIQHKHPLSFFGYILFLEGLGAIYGKQASDKAHAAHGARASHFLRVHAEDDIEHIERAFAETDKFSPHIQNLIAENLTLSAGFYELMLKESREVKLSGQLRKAA